MLFLLTLLSGLLITISSNSWLNAWMGLEINLLSFVPLMSNNDNILMTEASLKYFLIQAIASSALLFIIISKSLNESMFTLLNQPLMSIILMVPLLLKSGVAPMHWWFPSVMEGLSWSNCLILMIIQKMAPLLLISYTIQMNNFMMSIILLSMMIGTIGGYNQVSIRKIMAYSSINHLGWMLAAMMMSESMWMLYFIIYSTLSLAVIMIVIPMQISFVNQIHLVNKEMKILKFMLVMTLLSLGGLPPFLGFLPKWFIIQQMMMNWSMIIISIMVILSLITLYYYLRLTYSSFIILSFELSWSHLSFKNEYFNLMSIITTMISTMGLMICMSIMNSF
uniref:NADH-ubiquinone oxidoreductase chain 2 n=1 Tax=Neolaxta sp. B107 TaxID=2093474 RepID=A0A2P1H8W5_9NEOP|nr:NADH dehydrogenase subunit 2 [Neolaxta sp. B107]